MSRIGKKPIPVPDKVKVEIKPEIVVVTGPKGSVTNPIPPGIKFEQKDKQVLAIRQGDSGPQKAFHGLARALVANAVRGVTEGFSKELEIVGVGYRAESKKNSVMFTLGYSHPIEYPIPPGISISVDKQTKHIYAQIIDDSKGATLIAASSLDADAKKDVKHGGNVAAAKAVGKLVAERAKAKGIDAVLFDRGGYLYHGRVKALAEAAREAGLKF